MIIDLDNGIVTWDSHGGKRSMSIDELVTTYERNEVLLLLSIPIEWIKWWAMKSENTYNREQIFEMLNEWEKEFESNDDY